MPEPMGRHKFAKWKLDSTKRNTIKRRIEEADKTIQEEIRRLAETIRSLPSAEKKTKRDVGNQYRACKSEEREDEQSKSRYNVGLGRRPGKSHSDYLENPNQTESGSGSDDSSSGIHRVTKRQRRHSQVNPRNNGNHFSTPVCQDVAKRQTCGSMRRTRTSSSKPDSTNDQNSDTDHSSSEECSTTRSTLLRQVAIASQSSQSQLASPIAGSSIRAGTGGGVLFKKDLGFKPYHGPPMSDDSDSDDDSTYDKETPAKPRNSVKEYSHDDDVDKTVSKEFLPQENPILEFVCHASIKSSPSQAPTARRDDKDQLVSVDIKQTSSTRDNSQQPKSRKPRNPLQVQQLQDERDKELRQNNVSSAPINDDALWDSDDDAPTTSSNRRKTHPAGSHASPGQPKPLRRAAQSNPRQESKHVDKEDVDRDATISRENDILLALPMDSVQSNGIYYSENDEQIDNLQQDYKPNLANPHFGPFFFQPLSLVNKETGCCHHQVPAALSRYLPEFQRVGIQFLYSAVSEGGGAILGDDMGLGKTLQLIALITALLGKTGTKRDEVVLERRERELKCVQQSLDRWQQSVLLGQRGFGSGKDQFLAEQKKKLQLPEFMPILILVPASVIDNWHYEFTLWGQFRVAVYRVGNLRDEALKSIDLGSSEVLLCGHSLFSADKEYKRIEAIQWKLVVVDEFHVFKTPKGKLSTNMRTLSKKYKFSLVGLTGTPMPNNFDELYNLIDLVQPKVLGPRDKFKQKFEKAIKIARAADATEEHTTEGEKRRRELHALLQPLYIQRTKLEVLKDMPTKIEHVVLCELSELQKKCYEHIRSLPDFLLVRGANAACDCGANRNYFFHYKNLTTDAEKKAYIKDHSFKKRCKCCHKTPQVPEKTVFWRYQHGEGMACERCPACVGFPCLQKLYQLSSHLGLLQFDRSDKTGEKKEREKNEAFARVAFPEEVLRELPGGSYDRRDELMQGRHHFAMSGKMKRLDELLKLILQQKGRVLLFSYSTRTLDVIQRYMDSEAHRYLRIDGSTPAKDRQGLVNKFQKDQNILCFLLSTRAAGVGLNLTAANNVIIFDAEWNPALDEQAQDRSFRIGQTRDVSVYRLVAQGTIDELKYLRQIYKLHLKQETFRSADGSDAAAPPRSFLGVSNDKNRKGELFGMENLMKFSKDSSFVEKVWKTSKKGTQSSLVAGTSKEIAEAWGGDGESALDEETNAVIQKEIEVRVQDNRETFDHKDLLHQGRVRTAYTQDRSEIICGETQNAMEFVPCQNEENAVEASEHDDDNDIDVGDHTETVPNAADGGLERGIDVRPTINTRNGKIHYPVNRSQSDEDNVAGNDDSPALCAPRKPQNVRGKLNVTLCGIPVTRIREKQTTFSEEDIFLPTGAY